MASTPQELPVSVSRAGRVARVARDAARSLDEVADATSGRGRWATPDRDGAVGGAIAVARPDGRFDVELHLIARPVPLHALGERIRERIDRDARQAGVAELVGPVDIVFEDVEEAPGRRAERS
jgi:hypothetical protein